jgi:hypothetical protein
MTHQDCSVTVKRRDHTMSSCSPSCHSLGPTIRKQPIDAMPLETLFLFTAERAHLLNKVEERSGLLRDGQRWHWLLFCGGEVHLHNSCELSRIPFALNLGHACIFYRSSKLNDAPPMHAAEYLQHGAPRSGNAKLVLEHIDSQKRESRRIVAPTIASTDNNGQLELLRDTAGPQAISVKAMGRAVGRG